MSHEKYMLRAIELASKGLGHVSPNPLVGCVVVHDGRIIGEGFHKQYGQAHAEVNAISSVKNKAVLKEADLYVTLEPCAHFGKTPPCADLIIEKQFKRVIIGTRDPFIEVNGAGIEKLLHAGIEVITGIMENECRWINRRFFCFEERKRPYIILKWAQTQDHYLAREDYDSKWISNVYSRQLVHRWRSEEDAILIGRNTAHYDNPSLTVRDWSGKNPLRVVIDSKLSLRKDLKVFDEQAPTLVMAQNRTGADGLSFDGSIESILNQLYERKIQSVIIEGGTKTLNLFIESNLWDEARIFTSKSMFMSGIKAPNIQGELLEEKDVMGDQLTIIKRDPET